MNFRVLLDGIQSKVLQDVKKCKVFNLLDIEIHKVWIKIKIWKCYLKCWLNGQEILNIRELLVYQHRKDKKLCFCDCIFIFFPFSWRIGVGIDTLDIWNLFSLRHFSEGRVCFCFNLQKTQLIGVKIRDQCTVLSWSVNLIRSFHCLAYSL